MSSEYATQTVKQCLALGAVTGAAVSLSPGGPVAGAVSGAAMTTGCAFWKLYVQPRAEEALEKAKSFSPEISSTLNEIQSPTGLILNRAKLESASPLSTARRFSSARMMLPG
ncbi:MAG: hypothetical protein AAGC95_04075 [Pseudomonadota bacterium]